MQSTKAEPEAASAKEKVTNTVKDENPPSAAILALPCAPVSTYEKIHFLGKGSYGNVDVVRCIEDGQLYVMKTIQNITSGATGHEREAIQEVKILQTVQHPNVVSFREAFITEENMGKDRASSIHIVMDYCESGDLSKRIKIAKKSSCGARSFSEKVVLDWFVQLCLAIAHLHSHHILHRDIKPQNVFLTRSNRVVKLGDFGITKEMDSTSQLAITKIGTPYYFSPEICMGRPYGQKSDIWALGAVIYEVMTLQVPFPAATMMELSHKIINTKPKSPSKAYSQDLRMIVSSLLAKSAKRRPHSSQVLASAILQPRIQQFVLDFGQSASISSDDSTLIVYTDRDFSPREGVQAGHHVVTTVSSDGNRTSERQTAVQREREGPLAQEGGLYSDELRAPEITEHVVDADGKPKRSSAQPIEASTPATSVPKQDFNEMWNAMDRSQKKEFIEKKRAVVQAKLEQARLKMKDESSPKAGNDKALEELEDAFAMILKEQHKLRAQEAEEIALREVATLCRTQLNDPSCVAPPSTDDTEDIVDEKLEHADTFGFDDYAPPQRDGAGAMTSATS